VADALAAKDFEIVVTCSVEHRPMIVDRRLCMSIGLTCFSGLAKAVSTALEPRAALAQALQRQDLRAIKTAVIDFNETLGARRGVPETADRHTQIPFDAPRLTPAQAVASMPAAAAYIAQNRWWRIGLDPTRLSNALREPASAIVGLLAFSRVSKAMSLDGRVNKATDPRATASAHGQYLDAARQAGDFLLWAQSQAGSGVFPFPANRGNTNSAAFRSAGRQLARAEKSGLSNIVKNGWAIDDLDDGGLQFDNGECGIAIFELYDATQEKQYLDAALRSAAWAMQRPLVANWNYNSFSVRLLVRAYMATADGSFLDSAMRKSSLGVIPGQLTQGENTGRWGDPHNARPTYHYIMLHSLAELVAAMHKAKLETSAPSDNVIHALRLGLVARNVDFLPNGKGAVTKETAMAALLKVNSVFAGDIDFLRTTQSAEALDGLTKLVSSQFRRGLAPLAPGAWGLFVEHLAAP
jgi:hypothetical protein